MRLGSQQQLLRLGELLLVVGVEGIAVILQRIADGGELIVVDGHPAAVLAADLVPEILPARHRLRDLGGVDAIAGGAPILVHGIDLAVHRAGLGEALIGIGGGVVHRDQAEIERLDQIGGDIVLDRVVGGHEGVPAGAARLQLGIHLLVRAEDRELDLHPGRGGEFVEILRIVIVRPAGQRDPVAQIAGIGAARHDQLRHAGGERRHGRAEAGDAEEMAARDRSLSDSAAAE